MSAEDISSSSLKSLSGITVSGEAEMAVEAILAITVVMIGLRGMD